MSFRSVIISNPADLKVKNNNLIITNEDVFQIPIEDISVLVLESQAVNLTAKLLSKLSENSVATIICDDKHLPCSTVLPLNVHLVDIWVYNHINPEAELSRMDRISLVDLVNYECILDDKNISILNAIDKMVASYTTACSKKDYKLLKLPTLKMMEYHYYE